MEHRLYNTGDQIWVEDGKTVKYITHDGRVWEEVQEKHSHAHQLYLTNADGSQTWFGQRYGAWHVIKVLTADGRNWSEEDPVVKHSTGVEKAILRTQAFLSSLVLRALSA